MCGLNNGVRNTNNSNNKFLYYNEKSIFADLQFVNKNSL